MNTNRFSIIGGDLRNLKLANLLIEDGKKVSIFGFRDKKQFTMFKISDDLHSAIDENDIVVGPLPCSIDDETINAPFNSEKIYLKDIFKTMGKNQLFIAGKVSEKILHLAQVYNVYTVDILNREEMAVLNAIPTAEGAIQIAMEELPVTIHDSNALVLGYGRVGKMLSKMLKGIGANVYVEARKYSDIAWIKSCNYKPIFINELEKYISEMDVIFNTVPALVLNESLLGNIRRTALIIDLASKPGGVDFEKARNMELNVKWALSLPGKVAPITAAKFIKNTIYNILEELGV